MAVFKASLRPCAPPADRTTHVVAHRGWPAASAAGQPYLVPAAARMRHHVLRPEGRCAVRSSFPERNIVIVVTACALLGLIFGSFANVPIHRWPLDRGVSEPKRSACPVCDAPIRPRDNVPVVSWLLLGRQCRECQASIHWRYPLVEAVTALLFGIVAASEGATLLLPALLALTWSLVVVTAIDIEHRIIPNRLTYRLPFVLLVLLAPPSIWGPGSLLALRRGVVAAVLVPLGLFLLGESYRLLRGRAGFGMGDVKLLLSLGLVAGYLGGFEVAVLLYGAMLSAVCMAVTLLATGRVKLASRIPFGPYLAAGMLLAIVAGSQLRTPVLSLLGLA
jgi:leader peptidase (prepilin peptidase)/N-methyltransferase